MRKIIYKILYWTGLPFIFRLFYQRRSVTFLLFHNPSKLAFIKIVEYLKKKYNIITLSDFITNHKNGTMSNLPDYSVVLTFDDGHIDNYKLLPLFKKYNICPTIFLCTAMINTNKHFWFHHVPEGQSLRNLKRMDYSEMLKNIDDYSIDKEYDMPDVISKNMFDEMKEFVDFQVHALHHPCLPLCDDITTREEIFLSKVQLELLKTTKVKGFCFPNGDYTSREIKYVKEAGYEYAVTVDPEYNNKKTDLFHIKRFSLNDSNDINEIIVKSSGFWGILKQFL